MTKQKLIGFIGPRGSGKSTIAKELDQQGAFVTSFAEPIKDMLQAFELDGAQLYGNRKNEPDERLCGKTPRDAMIALGQVWGRQEMGPDIWVNEWRRRVLRLREAWPMDHLVVCDDLRQHDELKAFKELGGIAVYLLRPGVEPINHPSETLTAADADVIVRNNDRPEVVATVVLAACKL